MKRAGLRGAYSPTFYLALLSSLLFFSSINLLITPLPLYVEHIGGGPAEVGLAGSTFAIAALIIRPFMGRLVDNRGPKLALAIGAAVFTLGPLSYAVIGSIPVFQVARMFHGVGIAAFTSAYYTLIADVTPPSRWGAALGLAGIAAPFSVIVASPLGSTLLEHTSFGPVFVLAGMTALASLIMVLLIRPPRRQTATARSEVSTDAGFLDVIRIRGVLAPSLAVLTLGLSYGTTFSFLPLFGRERGLGNVGLFFTAFAIFLVSSRSVAGRLTDRVGRLPIILITMALLATSLVGLSRAYGLVAFLVMAGLEGIGFGGARVGLDTMVVDAAPARVRGMAVSLLYLGFDLGMVVSGVLMGVVADIAGYAQVYLIVGGVCYLTLVLFGAATRRLAAA